GIVKTDYEFNYYLNRNTFSKIYDWASIDSSNNSIDTLWSAWIDVWAVKVTKGLGKSTNLYAAIINGDTIGTITSVSQKSELLNNYFLFQNYPNPFNPSTEIKFILPENTYVEVSIYNSIGEKIEILFDGYLTKGSHKLKFNGNKMSSGIYLYMLKTNNHKLVKKMLLLK
ncbi:MAG: T9SS type A sorting domain-containing protein, partial [Ignavibacteriae bacterium]|nr:T9SS type A sorting domain-containing protein [Ignavibacteriota bacterium]